MKNQERRKRARLQLRLPVLFLVTEFDVPLRAETLDVSNNGFYCITSRPFAPGERLTCIIAVPIRAATGAAESCDRLYLEAKVDVVRIVVNSNNGFGVGCRISEYRIGINDSLRSLLEPPAAAVSAAAIEQRG